MGNSKNIKIISGSPIPTPATEQVSWSFALIDFSDTEISSFENKNIKRKDVQEMMKGKQHMIVVHQIGQDVDTHIVPGINSGNNDFDGMSKYPSAIVTNYGSLIPQILVPNSGSPLCDNGLGVGGSELNTSDSEKNQREQNKITGYIWKGSGLTGENNAIKNYGKRDEIKKFAGFVDMADARTSSQTNEIATRKYTLSKSNEKNIPGVDQPRASDTGGLQGACAIMYKFCATTDASMGRQGVCPKLFIKANNKSGKRAVAISIAADSDMFSRVGSDIGNGALNNPAQGFYPPQHSDIRGNCLFMYPLYAGFVFTGSGTRKGKDDNDGAFVKYSKINPALQNLELMNFESGDNTDNEMQQSTRLTPQAAASWFPSAISQSDSPADLKIKVNKPNSKLDDVTVENPIIQWQKALGKFAYCPIFFNKTMKFDLYFKGAYKYVNMDEDDAISSTPSQQTQNQSSGDSQTPQTKYYIYPIGYSRQTGNWDSISSNGMNCITDAKVFADGDDDEESIYKAQFKIESSQDMARQPIEIFGCLIAAKTTGSTLDVLNNNGSNRFSNWNIDYNDFLNKLKSIVNPSQDTTSKYLDFLTNLQVTTSLQGVTGSMDLDMYATDILLSTAKLDQLIGEIDLKVEEVDSSSNNTSNDSNPDINIFKGYGMQLKTNLAESNHSIGISLVGIQKKLQDMKLVCAPYWDGDKLQTICKYFQAYTGIKIKMIDYTISNFKDAKSVGSTWVSKKQITVNKSNIASPRFRVPRSFDYRKPAVDFQTGTSCFDALNKLGEMTSCIFVIGNDGVGYFYELNEFGYPYYVDNQTTVEEFSESQIISLNISPFLENRFNFFATMGFLQKRNDKTNIIESQTVKPGFIFTNIEPGEDNFPWSRMAVNIENGYLTKAELANMHSNNVKFGISEMFQGTVTVAGNQRITHIYQKIRICGVQFFVISIDHNIDMQTKSWTTSYGLSYFYTSQGSSQGSNA